MKVLIDDENSFGFESLIGERVFLFCINYFYTGRLVGVSEVEVLLEDCQIVYETGSFSEEGWKDAQRISFSNGQYIRTSSIESYSKVDVIVS